MRTALRDACGVWCGSRSRPEVSPGSRGVGSAVRPRCAEPRSGPPSAIKTYCWEFLERTNRLLQSRRRRTRDDRTGQSHVSRCRAVRLARSTWRHTTRVYSFRYLPSEPRGSRGMPRVARPIGRCFCQRLVANSRDLTVSVTWSGRHLARSKRTDGSFALDGERGCTDAC